MEPDTDGHRVTPDSFLEIGRKLFAGACARCHVDASTGRATGALAPDWPSWAGRFHGRNLTSDGAVGIGSLSDEDLARTIRAGLLAGGAPAIGMPSFPRMADDAPLSTDHRHQQNSCEECSQVPQRHLRFVRLLKAVTERLKCWNA